MDISIFDVTGPIMVGPSSSHTAGAARLSRIASNIIGKPFNKISFGLYGSFAKTYRGHGTDKALVAGALGLFEDDDRLENAFALAKKAGLKYEFYETNLSGYHENSVKMTFFTNDGQEMEIIGCSVGGGQIEITKIGSYDANISARINTIVTVHNDKKGVIRDVTKILAENEINIATMKLSRSAKGKTACCVIETDSPIRQNVEDRLRNVENMLSIQVINIEERR